MKTEIKIFRFLARAGNVVLTPTAVVYFMYLIFNGIYFLVIGESFVINVLDIALHYLFILGISLYCSAGIFLIDISRQHIESEIKKEEQDED